MVSIFTSQTPASADVVESGGIALGVTFVPSTDGTVTGIRFYASATVSGAYSGALFQPTADDDPEGSGAGTLLGSGALVAPPSPGAWNTIPLSPPVPVVAGTAYRAVYHSTAGHYVSTPAFGPFVAGGLTNGPLTAVAAGTSVGVGSVLQGVFRTGATLQYPSNYFGNSNYFADVVFEETATASGDADLPIVITMSAVGDDLEPNSGSVAFSLELTLAGEGSATPAGDLPCGWEGIDPEALGVCSDWSGYSSITRTAALEMSALFLWAATGRRFGACPITVRPSQDRLGGPVQYQAYPVWPGASENFVSGPFLFGGQWFNRGGSNCSSCCNSAGCAVVLRGPVAGVQQVTVDGLTVPTDAYRVDVTGGVYLLVRTDGECWPACNSDSSPFTVTYLIGRPLPAALALATALLACEYAKSLSGAPCKLPAKMTRLSRQGIEVELDSGDGTGSSTGIRQVDDVITALNPSKRQRPPVLLSPDLPENCDRVTVWP